MPTAPTTTFSTAGTDQTDVIKQFMEQVLAQQKQFMDHIDANIANLRSRSTSPERRQTPSTAPNVPQGAGVPPGAAPAGSSAQICNLGVDVVHELLLLGHDLLHKLLDDIRLVRSCRRKRRRRGRRRGTS